MPEADNEWRGVITERVRQHDARLSTLNGDLKEVWRSLNTASNSLIRLEGHVSDLKEDLTEAITEIRRTRQQEVDSLKGAIAETRGPSRREMVLYLAAPIIVGVIVGLILFAVTGALTGHVYVPPHH